MNRNCPCCNCAQKIPFYTTPISQNIVECLHCGMVYAVNTPAVDYSTNSIYASNTYNAQKEHYLCILDILCDYTKEGFFPGIRVLDVGCATGGLLQAFKEAGVTDVEGLSLSKEEVEFCRRKS